jgi:hypothetical protein
MSHATWIDTCSLCGQSRWWPSQVSDYKVCWWCSNGDPMAALVILARRGHVGMIRRAEQWARVGTDGGALQP